MKTILIFASVFLAIVSVHAQQVESVKYSQSFYDHTLVNCGSVEIIPLYNLSGDHIGDTTIMNPMQLTNDTIISFPLKKSFDKAMVTITSCANNQLYRVTSYEVIFGWQDGKSSVFENTGGVLSAEAANKLNTVQPGDHIVLRKMKAIDPSTMQMISLASMKFVVK